MEIREIPDTVLLLVNAGSEAVSFRLPVDPAGLHWEVEIDTSAPDPKGVARYDGGGEFPLGGRALALLCLQSESGGSA